MGWAVSATPWPLYPREKEPVVVLHEDGLAPGPVWTVAENFAPPVFDSQNESRLRLPCLKYFYLHEYGINFQSITK